MCGPSGAMKSLNDTVQQFTGQVTKEAGTVFGAANTVFNNIMNAVQGIVASGPNQLGFSTTENNALNAGAETAGATQTRNLKAAATSFGGNVATPAGATQAATMAAEQTGAATTASQKNQIATLNAETGQQNYWGAVQAEMQAPSAFGVANEFNATAGKQLSEAEKSQNAMDQAKNWWRDPVMKLAATAANFIPVAGPFISKGIQTMQSNYDATNASFQSDINSADSSWNPSGGNGSNG